MSTDCKLTDWPQAGYKMSTELTFDSNDYKSTNWLQTFKIDLQIDFNLIWLQLDLDDLHYKID